MVKRNGGKSHKCFFFVGFVLALQLSTFNISISDVRIGEKFDFGRISNYTIALPCTQNRAQKVKVVIFFVAAAVASVCFIPRRKSQQISKRKLSKLGCPEKRNQQQHFYTAMLESQTHRHRNKLCEWPNSVGLLYAHTKMWFDVQTLEKTKKIEKSLTNSNNS